MGTVTQRIEVLEEDSGVLPIAPPEVATQLTRRSAAFQYGTTVARRVSRDTPVYLVIALYGIFVATLAPLHDAAHLFSPFIYLRRWVQPLTLVIAAVLVSASYMSFKHSSPLRSFFRAIRIVLPPAKLASGLMFVALALFHGLFTSMKNIANRLVDFRFDPALADLDAALHLGDAWKLLPHWEPLTRIFQVQYVVLWLALLAITSCYATMYAKRPVRAQYIWTFLICWILLGNIVAMAVMSAGPAYYAEVTGSERYQPLMSYLALSTDSGYSSIRLQEMLWLRYTSESIGMGAGISAFPSLHLSMATLWTLLAFRVHSKLGWLMAAFTCATQIAAVHLGWHYAIDGYFSIAATVGVWRIVGYAQRTRSRTLLLGHRQRKSDVVPAIA